MRADLAVAMALPVTDYVFTAPSAIALGNMAPGTAKTGNSTGWLEGNNANGYTGDGVDDKSPNKGFMVSGGNVLANKLKMGGTAAVPNDADFLTTFLSTSSITDESVPFYVSQTVAYTDVVTPGYTITITFTVTEK